MKTAAAIARSSKTEGVEYLFCFPVNALIDECARVGIRTIVARTERTLLNMADGYSRVSNGRRIGVAAVQHGPGAENAYAGCRSGIRGRLSPVVPPRRQRGGALRYSS